MKKPNLGKLFRWLGYARMAYTTLVYGALWAEETIQKRRLRKKREEEERRRKEEEASKPEPTPKKR